MGKETDINCDMGEGVDNEHLLMPYISSANIACGGHAGDPATMTRVLQLSVKHNVKAGAHPGYPDPHNFGRKSMKISGNALVSSIKIQVDSLVRIAADLGVRLYHIKPHGALYNDAANDEKLALLVLEAIEGYKNACRLYLPPGSVIAEKASGMGFSLEFEAFADRAYNDDLTLVSRSNPGAIIHEPEDVLQHMLNIIEHGKVKTLSGKMKPLNASTFCIHGDHENSVHIARYIYEELKERGYVKKKGNGLSEQ